MIALRYFCGFSLQIFPYAFFCLYPFRDRFRLSTKKTMLMALSIFIVMVIPFSLIAQFNIGGDYRELIWNVIFYIALLLFGIFYCFSIQAKAAEKLFVFFVVMSYGFFVLAKPFLMLMERIRTMINADLESRIWKILCSLPALFILIASIAQFSSIINLSNNIVVHVMFVLFAVFAFMVYAVFFSVMGYIRSKQEEQRISERMLESYRNQAENNEHILEIHHEIRHHMNALSSYLNQEDYAGARQYTQKFTEEAEELPFVTYTANALVNSILSEFAERASRYKAIVEYSIVIGRSLNMEDIDLCRMLTNILENAVEGCQKVSEEQRIIRLNLHSKGNFLFIKCENSCNEDNLRITNGKYKSSKKNSDKHGYGLKIINGIAEKYNGILNVQVRGGFFAVTTTLCLDENNE